jgi:hypothetical protein
MKTALAALFCLAAGLSLASPALAQAPTMDALWPNEDGRSWRYDQHYESYDANQLVLDNQIRIFLDGTTVAPNGIQAQYLRQEVIAGPVTTTALATLVPDAFLRSVWVARPDLQQKILNLLADSPCPENAPVGSYAVLLNGEFAYRKTAQEIAAWRCNAVDTRSWLWLVSDLTIGNTFTLQLIPDIATDIFLHGKIAAIESATVPAGTFDDCVRVEYVIDYGIVTCVDDAGAVIGTSRSETHGYIHYAPLVGPVESFEEFIRFAEATGTCAAPGDIGRVFARASLRLSSPTVPVTRTTWGRLKASYR